MLRFPVAASLMAVLLAAPTWAGTEWTGFRGGAAGTGVADVSVQPALPLLWKHSTEKYRYNRSSPLVADGKVFFSSSRTVYCLEEETGAEVWHLELGSRVRSTGAVHGGTLYIPCTDSKMYAINTKTGSVVWEFPTKGALFAPPLVIADRLLFGSNDSNIYCLDIGSTDVHLVWKLPTGGAVASTPAVNAKDGIIYCSSSDARVYGVDLKTGAVKWKYLARSPYAYSSPVYVDGRVIVASGNVIQSLMPRTGRRQWRRTLEERIVASLAADDGIVYFGTGGHRGVFRALEARNGRDRWTTALGAEIWSTATIGPQSVWVGCNNGVFTALNREDGAISWQYRINQGIPQDGKFSFLASPAVTDRGIYMLGDDGVLYAFGSDSFDEREPVVVKSTLIVPAARRRRAGYNLEPDEETGALPLVRTPGTPPITVRIQLEDEGSGINGEAVELALERDSGNSKMERVPVGKADFNASTGELEVDLIEGREAGHVVRRMPDGAYVLTITARDWAGNAATIVRRFEVDNNLKAPSVGSSEERSGGSREEQYGE